MNTITNAVDQVREQGRALYKQIEANTSTRHEAIRGDIQSLADQSASFASALRRLAKDQGADSKAHLEHAASLIEAASNDAKALTTAANADVGQKGSAMREHLRDALQNISQAVAATRSKSKRPA